MKRTSVFKSYSLVPPWLYSYPRFLPVIPTCNADQKPGRRSPIRCNPLYLLMCVG